ncbi:hypothetical protein [Halovivax sp.]|uniref:hypothetical protein n=1 Tax=Halovivax sp. TaxID=1935978 RepID=UPI0025B7E37E|nr:hypothetical protein [Halovivax sp.]
MIPDQEPIPHDDVPPGWGPVRHDDDRIVYRRHEPQVELEVARTTADRSHPALGLGRCWELRFRHLVGEHPVTERIGRVSTRRAALDGLRESMERIHRRVEDPSDPVSVRSVLQQTPLAGNVPEFPEPDDR